MKGIGNGDESEENRKFEYASAESFGVKKYGIFESNREFLKKKRIVTKASFIKKRDLWMDPKKLSKNSQLRRKGTQKKFSAIVDERISKSVIPKFQGETSLKKNNFVNSSRRRLKNSFIKSYQEQPVRFVKVSRVAKFTCSKPIHRSDKRIRSVLYTSNMKKRQRKKLKSQRKMKSLESRKPKFNKFSSLFDPTPPRERPKTAFRGASSKISKFHNSFVLKKSKKIDDASMKKSKSAIKVNKITDSKYDDSLIVIKPPLDAEPRHKREIISLIKRSFNIGKMDVTSLRDPSKSSYVRKSSLEQNLVQNEKKQRKKRWPVNKQKLLFSIIRSQNKAKRSKFIRSKRASVGMDQNLRGFSHHYSRRASLISRKKQRRGENNRPHLAMRLVKNAKKRMKARKRKLDFKGGEGDSKEYELQQMMKLSHSPCKPSEKRGNKSQRYVNSFLVDCYETK